MFTAKNFFSEFFDSPLGYAVESCDIGFAVPHPIHSNNEMTLKLDNIIGFIILISSLVIGMKWLQKACRISEFDSLQILSCILGSSLTGEGRWKDRIFYSTMIGLSFWISNDLINYATEWELEETWKSVENIQDIIDLNVSIYSPYDRKNVEIFHDRHFDNRWVKIGDDATVDCLDALHENNDRICLEQVQSLIIYGAATKACDRLNSLLLPR